MASVFVEVVEKKCTAIIVRKLNEVLHILGFVNGDVMERWNRLDACGLGLVREGQLDTCQTVNWAQFDPVENDYWPTAFMLTSILNVFGVM